MILERCPWYLAGPLVGLLMVGFRHAEPVFPETRRTGRGSMNT